MTGPVPALQDKEFDDEGNLIEKAYERRTANFLDELVWMDGDELSYGREHVQLDEPNGDVDAKRCCSPISSLTEMFFRP